MKKICFALMTVLLILAVLPVTQVLAETYKVGLVTIGEELPIPPGGFEDFTITVTRGTEGSATGKFDADITLSSSLPEGVSITFLPVTIHFTSKDNTATSTLRITVAPNTPSGTFRIDIKVTRNDAPYDYKPGYGTFIIENNPPSLDPISVSTAKVNTLLTFTASASDPDGDDLTFSLEGETHGASITSSGEFRWTPTSDQFHQSLEITVRVTDFHGLYDEQTIVVYVRGNVLPGESQVLLGEVELDFTEITVEGIASSDSSESPPLGMFELHGLIGDYYDITVAAGFDGKVIVTIHYDDSDLPEGFDENLLQLAVNHGYDFNNDGIVNVKDQTLLTNAINNNGPGGEPRYDPTYDLNHDGKLNNADLRVLKPHLGENAWVDITQGVNPFTNIIWGETDQFSGFGVHR